jgi:hypothetical protein
LNLRLHLPLFIGLDFQLLLSSFLGSDPHLYTFSLFVRELGLAMKQLSLSLLLYPLCVLAQSYFTPRVFYGSNSYQPVPTGQIILPEQHAIVRPVHVNYIIY